MSIVIEENIMVPMRDGIKLATDVYRPAEIGQWPVLVTRVPYNKDLRIPAPGQEHKRLFLELNLDVERVIEAGYVIVAQDTRGCFASEGEFTPGLYEETDGFDTIAWAARQPWSSGKVGMYGVSYQGLTQWQAAGEQPEALRAIAPTQSPDPTTLAYQGGAFLLGIALSWTLQGLTGELLWDWQQGRIGPAEFEEVVQAEQNIKTWYERLPLVDIPLFRDRAPYYFEWLAHPNFDDYWRTSALQTVPEHVTIPALITAGWYDIFLNKDLHYYRSMKERGGNILARQQTRLLIGPWPHGDFQSGFAERNYGEASDAMEMLTTMQIRWFDHWLKGLETGLEREKPVKIFVMGINQWREEEDWPLPDTRYTPYYLHSEGQANTAQGNGRLSTQLAGEEAEDSYCYDPLQPVPTLGGALLTAGNGPRDQREIEARQDVLCYTTEPLEQAVEVTGTIELVLYVSSSAPDTDFTGKLVDVFPDGYAQNLTDGIVRMRYRQSLAQPALMEHGQIYEVHINLGATSNVFLANHRIRLEVSSSNFPRFDRNSNTGGTIATESAQDMQQAINRIYHDSLHPSHLLLPLIERSQS
ncbi:CocE/NonD family hydrolase [Ktedonosporobacter rubrisoli]|uniref:CocE/NonD family hydrolase n=1 Tax=Ktedonosporobacter rubrisoli TaxID=2509675 RepID=A0A4P6JIJ6_KTERU|nr:CocE/NonD family hydrolase [Ktedonosporobacter rubrisoli]QBD74889.1 CocE/NonD family hydrolase [Ktedonosporobacter rubrisoli]